MLKSDKNFIRYYDLIYSKKEYNSEIDYIVKCAKKYGIKTTGKLLDVGCGTGNHTINFSQNGYDITGIDIDDLMINAAIEKAKLLNQKISFKKEDITNAVFDSKFDVIYSWFFVINYIDDLYYLNEFFKGISRNLNNPGIYLFDTWNSNATSSDPPKLKTINIDNSDSLYINGSLNPNFDTIDNTALFHYKFEINDNKNISNFENKIKQIYWNPYVLKQLLNNSGFTEIYVYKYLTLDSNITKDDYKISWICVKR